MKRSTIFPIVLFFVAVTFLKCQPPLSPETTLTGTVRSFEADSLKISYLKNNWWEGYEDIWVSLDSTGHFTVTLPVNSLKEFRIMQSSVYLKPGWQTTLNIYMNEEGEMDFTTFEGDGAEENEVYNKGLNLIFDVYNHMNREPGEFIAFLDSIDQVLKADVGSLKDVDQEFVTMLRNNIAYHKMNGWESYAREKFDFAGKDRPDSLDLYSSQFNKLVVFDNAELLNSFLYKAMLEDHFNEIVRDNIDFDALLEINKGDQEKAKEDYNEISFNLMLDLADSIISNPEIKSYIYCNAFSNVFLRNVGLQMIEPLKQNFRGRFREVVTDTSKINYVASQIDRLKSLSPGMPAPTFSFPDTTGNLVSLTVFTGRYVYIDIWATWCGPCIQEIPKLKELEKEFGDEIAFISISVDNEKETWHKFVREKELTGIQLLSQGGQNAEIMDLYMIQAIPRFIIIDPNGNLVDVDTSKPSYDKTKKLFERLTGRKQISNREKAT